jgi:hypothetical protein
MATMIKEFMMLTIVPAVLGLYISIRPLFLLKKTAFERKTKKHLMVIASLLLFNTLVTPVAAIATLTHREAVRRLEVRADRMAGCFNDVVKYNKKVAEGDYDDYASAHFESFELSNILDGSFDQFLMENNSLGDSAFEHCTEIRNSSNKKLSEEYRELTDYCDKATGGGYGGGYVCHELHFGVRGL